MSVKLDIREQPRLPVARQMEICGDGLRHRLFRSTITLSVIVLAIAFLMNVLTESVTAQAMRRGVAGEAAQVRRLASFNGFFTPPGDAEAMRRRLLDSPPEHWQGRTLAAWLGMNDASYMDLHAQCAKAQALRKWFDRLSIADRRVLFASRSIDQAVANLATPGEAEAFEGRLRTIPTLSLSDDLLAFARSLPAFEDKLREQAGVVAAKIAAITSAMPHPTLLAWLEAAGTDEASKRALTNHLAANQVALPAGLLDELTTMARQRRQDERLAEALGDPRVAAAWRGRFGELMDRGKALTQLANDPPTQQWLAGQLGADDAAWIGDTAVRANRTRLITETADLLDATYGDSDGLGENVIWLIVVSLLVCIVGITNAMLISVIERFREIATMKCLGALDGFIATLFLMEAALLGALGGAAGVVLGVVIGLIRMWLSYGEWVGRFFPWTGLLVAAGASIFAGLALATVAAMYPAFRASKMPPMEAMRVE